MTIKLNSIASAPWNPRTDITPESVAELAADIEKNGLIQPITVWKDADGAWLCIAGNRRLAAIQEINKGSQIVLPPDHYIVFGGTEAEARALTFRENHHRLNLTPLGEAAQIAQFISDGMTVADAAVALGITETKARRRSRLCSLSDEWKARNDLTVDVLERVSTFPVEVQKKVAKRIYSGARSWREIKGFFDSEAKDLDYAKFDTSPCRECLKRTGVEADLFGVSDGSLGQCLDCGCFKAKRKAWEDEVIAAATKGANEVVRCNWWDMPSDEESSDKRSKKRPCAYVTFNSDDELVVRWGESKAEAEAREEAEEEARRIEREADEEKYAEKRKRVNGIVEKVKSVTYDGGDEIKTKIEAHIAKAVEAGDENVIAWLTDLGVGDVCGWNNEHQYAQLLRILPELADEAGLSEDDREYFLGEYPEDDEDGDE